MDKHQGYGEKIHKEFWQKTPNSVNRTTTYCYHHSLFTTNLWSLYLIEFSILCLTNCLWEPLLRKLSSLWRLWSYVIWHQILRQTGIFNAMRISHLIRLKFMVFQNVMPCTKVISIFTTARNSSLLKFIFILFIPCNKTCFVLLKTNNLHMQKIQIYKIWCHNNITASNNVEYIRWLHVWLEFIVWLLPG